MKMSEVKFQEEKEYLEKLGDFALREYIYSRDKTACLKKTIPRETIVSHALELARAGPALQLATYHTTEHDVPAVRRSLRKKLPTQPRAVEVATARGPVSDNSPPKKISPAKPLGQVGSTKKTLNKSQGRKGSTNASTAHTSGEVPIAPKGSPRSGGGESATFDFSDMIVNPMDLRVRLGTNKPFLSPKLVKAVEDLRLQQTSSKTAPLGSNEGSSIKSRSKPLAPPHLPDRSFERNPNRVIFSSSAAGTETASTLTGEQTEHHQLSHDPASPKPIVETSQQPPHKVLTPFVFPISSLESIPIESILQEEVAEREAVHYLDSTSVRIPDVPNPIPHMPLTPGSESFQTQACLQEDTSTSGRYLQLEADPFGNRKTLMAENAPQVLVETLQKGQTKQNHMDTPPPYEQKTSPTRNTPATFLLLNTKETTSHISALQHTDIAYKSLVFQDMASLEAMWPDRALSINSTKPNRAFLRLLPPSDTASTSTVSDPLGNTRSVAPQSGAEPSGAHDNSPNCQAYHSFGINPPCTRLNSPLPSAHAANGHESGGLTGVYAPSLCSPLLMDVGNELMSLNSPEADTVPLVKLSLPVAGPATCSIRCDNPTSTTQDSNS